MADSKWVQDIKNMHDKFGVHAWVNEVGQTDMDKLREYLAFRLRFIYEEYNETAIAVNGNDAEEIVDGLIDICVVAIGTLDAFGVDADEAWDRVHTANMAKQVGQKDSRPNPLGLPDLIKPDGWVGPDHDGNHGLLSEI